jgi:hypothetical protein
MSFTRAQGIPKCKIGFGRGREKLRECRVFLFGNFLSCRPQILSLAVAWTCSPPPGGWLPHCRPPSPPRSFSHTWLPVDQRQIQAPYCLVGLGRTGRRHRTWLAATLAALSSVLGSPSGCCCAKHLHCQCARQHTLRHTCYVKQSQTLCASDPFFTRTMCQWSQIRQRLPCLLDE